MNILVLQGPNLNMLGIREQGTYGKMTLGDIHDRVSARAGELGVAVSFFQSNSEGELITRIQEAYGTVDGIIINAGAYTHTSVGIRDALLAVAIPFIEVHISNIFSREPFRHASYLSDVAVGIISGFREKGYIMALDYFASVGER